jgi:hypothetical protein
MFCTTSRLLCGTHRLLFSVYRDSFAGVKQLEREDEPAIHSRRWDLGGIAHSFLMYLAVCTGSTLLCFSLLGVKHWTLVQQSTMFWPRLYWSNILKCCLVTQLQAFARLSGGWNNAAAAVLIRSQFCQSIGQDCCLYASDTSVCFAAIRCCHMSIHNAAKESSADVRKPVAKYEYHGTVTAGLAMCV